MLDFFKDCIKLIVYGYLLYVAISLIGMFIVIGFMVALGEEVKSMNENLTFLEWVVILALCVVLVSYVGGYYG